MADRDLPPDLPPTDASWSDTLSLAVAHLSAADPRLAAVIETVGPCLYAPARDGAPLAALMRSIVYQQLSGKAAGTIHRRFLGLYNDRPPTPTELLATPEDTLRSVGLSRQKLGYLRSLAETVQSGALPLDRLDEMTDDAILTALVQVKGIGRWTGQMVLMFHLGRLDVLPELDLGIQNAIQRAYALGSRPTPKQVAALGAVWAPYRTVASWYLWRFIDGPAA